MKSILFFLSFLIVQSAAASSLFSYWSHFGDVPLYKENQQQQIIRTINICKSDTREPANNL